MHSKNLEISHTEMTRMTDKMIQLLEDRRYLVNQSECQEAVRKIKELRDNSLEISLNKTLERKALKERMLCLDVELKTIKTEMQRLKDQFDTMTDNETRAEEHINNFEELKKSLQSVTNQISTILSENSNFESHIKILSDCDDELKQNIADIMKEFQNIKDSTEVNLKQMSESIAIINTTIVQLQEESNKHKKTFGCIRTDISHLKETAEEQTRMSDQLRTDLNSAETNIKKHDKAIHDLDENIQTVVEHQSRQDSAIECLKTKLGSVECTLKENKEGYDCILEQSKRHEDMLEEHASSISTLQQTIQCNEGLHDARLVQSSRLKCIQRKLTQHYIHTFNDVPIYPFIFEETGTLEDLYVEPLMKYKDQYENRNIACFKDILLSPLSNEAFRNVYLLGEPGAGKTTLSQYLVISWCQVKSPKCRNTNIEWLNEFDLLYFLPLRCYKAFVDIESMINDLMEEDVTDMLKTCKTLIILDGLDEWECPMEQTSYQHVTVGLSNRRKMNPYTILTTTRPWKFERIRPRSGEIDQTIEILGLDFESSEALANKALKLLNSRHKQNKQGKLFLKEVYRENLSHLLPFPILLLQMLCLWFDEKSLGNSMCEVYFNIVDRQLGLAEKCKELQPIENIRKHNLKSNQTLRIESSCTYLQKYLIEIEQLSQLAFDTLFHPNDSALVFDYDEVDLCGMSADCLQLFLKVGLLSQTKVQHRCTKRSMSINFIHKTFHEFFAALYLVQQKDGAYLEYVFNSLKSIERSLNMNQFLIYVFGMDTYIGSKLIDHINLLISDNKDILRYRESCEQRLMDHTYELVLRIQNMVLQCAEEAERNNQNVVLPLDDLAVDDLRGTVSGVYKHLKHLDMHHLRSACISTNITDVRKCDQVPYQKVFGCVKCSPMIQKLYLSNITILGISAEDVLELVLKSSTKLKALNLEYIDLSMCDENFQCVLNSLSLISLGLRWEVYLTHEQFECLLRYFHTADSLKHLCLNGIVCANHDGEREKRCKYPLQISSKQLHTLSLKKVSASSITFDVSNLTFCDISYMYTPGGAPSLFVLLKKALNLKQLRVTKVIHDEDLESLVQNLPYMSSLKELYLDNIDLGELIISLPHDVKVTLYDVQLSCAAWETMFPNICMTYNSSFRKDKCDVRKSETSNMDTKHVLCSSNTFFY